MLIFDILEDQSFRIGFGNLFGWREVCQDMDTVTIEKRHEIMSHIRGKNSNPEVIVRKYLFSRGLRYRKNYNKLPGHPDIALPKYKTVVFVNGCFWHGHEGCRYFHLPSSNVDFWTKKIRNNRDRDIKKTEELEALGWNVITVWECQIKRKADRIATLESVYQKISLNTEDPSNEEATENRACIRLH